MVSSDCEVVQVIVYFDMDGVLSDFDRRYYQLFGVSPKAVSDDKESNSHRIIWHKFIDTKQFQTLDLCDNASKLIQLIDRYKSVQFAILSSTGGFQRYNDVAEQKRRWLIDHNITIPHIFVPARKYKRGYANSQSILIDDVADNTKDFIENGGSAVTYAPEKYENAIVQITKLLEGK